MQEDYLEDVLREGYGHPAVKGIVIWPTSPFSSDFKMCLTDQNFSNTPNGDVIDKIIKEVWAPKTQEIMADGQGIFDVHLPHGDYEVHVMHFATNSYTKLKFKVDENSTNFVHVQINTLAPYDCM